MNNETKEKIEVFLRERMANIDATAKQYTADKSGKPYPKRDVFKDIYTYVDDFLQGNTDRSWCVITGLRGVGKTTILMQILSEIDTRKIDTLFLSVDKITELLNVSLADVLHVYEEITGSAFEKREKQLILFIDEAQYDKKWGVTLKDVHDRAMHKVFIYTTGSATLPLSMDGNVRRRPAFVEMLPLSFTEYISLKNQKPVDSKMQEQIQDALLKSKNASDAHKKMLALKNEIKKYYADIDPREVQRYIKEGSLPALLLSKPEEVFTTCNKTLEKIIGEDASEVFNFKTSTIRKAPTVLYTLASADQVSYDGLGKTLSLNRHTTKNLLDAFVKAGVLTHVPAYTSSHNKQVRQKSKFLFTAPVFRSAIFNQGGSVLSPNAVYAKLLEDVIGLTLHRTIRFNNTPKSFLTYDAQEGGADFVVGFSEKKIVIEVGTGKKKLRQVKQTAKRADSTYNIVIDNTTDLSLDTKSNTIKVPLEYFLLM